jgi:hypothetical protein
MAFSDFRQVPPRLPRRRDSPPRPQRISPDYPHHHSNVPCPLPRWTEMGAHVGCFPTRSGLPRTAVGSASTSSLSRPAQASRVLRPAGSLSRPAAAFVTRLRPGWLPDQVARQLPVQPTILWVEPPSTGVTRLRGALLSKKSKIEELPKSRESPFLAASAAASLSRTRTKLCGRSLVILCGPPHRRA